MKSITAATLATIMSLGSAMTLDRWSHDGLFNNTIGANGKYEGRGMHDVIAQVEKEVLMHEERDDKPMRDHLDKINTSILEELTKD